MSKKIKKVNIPNLVRITPKISYEVLFTDLISENPDTLGEMRPDVKQIIIKNNQSSTELVKTFIHEVFHAISDEHGIGLTEAQVKGLELGVYRFLRLNGYL